MDHITRTSAIKNVLLGLSGADSKEEMIVQMIKSFNGMIDPTDRNRFSNMVRI